MGTLKLQVFNTSTWSEIGDESLGTATESDTDERIAIAFPYTVPTIDDTVFVAGRMPSVSGIGLAHIIRSDDVGSTFADVESGWGGDHCGSLVLRDDGGGDVYMLAARVGEGVYT